MQCFVYVWSIETKMCIEYKNEHINEEQVVTGEVVVEVIMLWPVLPDTVSRALYVSFTHLLLIRNLIPGIIADNRQHVPQHTAYLMLRNESFVGNY